MILFVTGGTGFIGSRFIKDALNKGYKIYALRRPNKPSKFNFKTEPIWVEGNLGDDFKNILKKCDILIHFSAFGVSPQPSNWEECLYWNVQKSTELFIQAIESGIDKFIVSGTFAEYGKEGLKYDFIPASASLNPTGAYATSKAFFNKICKELFEEYSIKIIYLRLFSVYGENQNENNLWPSLKKAALQGEDFRLTKGEQLRDFISILDVSNYFIKSLETIKNLRENTLITANVGSGKPKTVKQFAKFWWESWKAKGELQIGSIPYRKNEVMRFVPEIENNFIYKKR